MRDANPYRSPKHGEDNSNFRLTFVSLACDVAFVVCYGAVVGASWSLLPAFGSDLFAPHKQLMSVLLSGTITGVVLSVAIATVSTKAPWAVVLLIGIASLPVGGFVFGITICLVQRGLSSDGDVGFRFAGDDVSIFDNGVGYALNSLVPPLCLFLGALAILSTFGLVFLRPGRTKINRR